jgi:hypothetical protein
MCGLFAVQSKSYFLKTNQPQTSVVAVSELDSSRAPLLFLNVGGTKILRSSHVRVLKYVLDTVIVLPCLESKDTIQGRMRVRR